ncbi:MAG: hypothetical protein ACAI35_22750 [Candidatus Methylacidiphilales bacterium]|nr:hypothetical protein [Candidatus Methylacidiphilales bacterium]
MDDPSVWTLKWGKPLPGNFVFDNHWVKEADSFEEFARLMQYESLDDRWL